MKTPKFDEIRIENTNHCSYSCFFCPREKLTRPKGFMPIEDLELVLSQVSNFSGQVDLHGFGEPLLDKKLVEKIGLVKKKWATSKSRIYSTLGIKLKEEQIVSLLHSGLDTLEVSFYGTNKEAYFQTHGVDGFEIAKTNLKALCEMNKKNSGSLKIVIRDFPTHDQIKPGRESQEFEQFEQWLTTIGVSEIRTRELHNYGSGRNYNISEEKGICSVVWGYRLRILQVTWDLNIIPCCFDFNSSIVLGNLKQMSIEDIFDSELYKEFINAHRNNTLSEYKACVNCEKCFKA